MSLSQSKKEIWTIDKILKGSSQQPDFSQISQIVSDKETPYAAVEVDPTSDSFTADHYIIQYNRTVLGILIAERVLKTAKNVT